MNRRNLLKNGLIVGTLLPASQMATCQAKSNMNNSLTEDSITHSICRWCYNKTPLEELAERAKDLGIGSIELLNVEEWDVVIDKGLECGIANGSPLMITKGFNDPQYHKQLWEDYSTLIPQAADKGIKQIICFSGNRNGITDEQGLENCAIGLEPVLKLAQKHNIKVVMELLNSKVDHKDYQCDHTTWGVALVEKLGSPQFKLLYDIYHMQIMEGDVIRTIQDNIDYISHFHTGGVPGRNEIDETQELNYHRIINAIREAGFEGFVAQEFIPTWEDPFAALGKALQICSS